MTSSILIAMPCYDSVKVSTMVSIFQLIQHLGKSNVEVEINTMKSPLVHQARNYLTSVFLMTNHTYLLFIDSDVEFEPEAVLRMLMAEKDIICTPYRIKNDNIEHSRYTVEFDDPKAVTILPGGLVEIQSGPAGLMLIHRNVFEKIIKNCPDLKIKNKAVSEDPIPSSSHDFYYNFFDLSFNEGYSTGEDVSFCRLARKNDFKLYANIDSITAHRGEYAWTGKFRDILNENRTRHH
tara:strand:+ start:441 stop:1148 length:708 start_codon:yes stop_codon:yes gene_type:complete